MQRVAASIVCFVIRRCHVMHYTVYNRLDLTRRSSLFVLIVARIGEQLSFGIAVSARS